MECEVCGKRVRVNPDTIRVVCSWCTMRKVFKFEQDQREKAEKERQKLLAKRQAKKEIKAKAKADKRKGTQK